MVVRPQRGRLLPDRRLPLGIMYYFVPKQANRPIYSYRLSIIHFWALIFLYIWAGPHHLHYTALPDWAQTLGMGFFSIMLWMPSWGGMINGLMTLVGGLGQAQDRSDHPDDGHRHRVLRHGHLRGADDVHQGRQLAVALHGLDPSPTCIPVRLAGLGLISFAALYYLVPRLWGREKLYSTRLVSVHVWTATLGIVVYAAVMWVSGIMQGLMWREYDDPGLPGLLLRRDRGGHVPLLRGCAPSAACST